MKSATIYKIISDLASDSSKNHKLQVLRFYDNNPDWLGFVKMVYDPLTRFGIKKVPEYTDVNYSDWDIDQAMVELLRLSSREFTGNNAKAHLLNIINNSHPITKELVEMLIAKDIKAGVNVSMLNDAYGKNFIKEAPYQGAVAYKDKLVKNLFASEQAKGFQLASQIKADGRYANIIIRDGQVYVEARSGLETVVNGAFDFLAPIETFYGQPCVLNGEITIFGINRYTSNGIVSSFVSINTAILEGQPLKKTEKEIAKFNQEYSGYGITWTNVIDKLSYIVWDIIPLEVYESFGEVRSQPYHERLAFLQTLAQTHAQDTNIWERLHVVETKIVATPEEAMEHFRSVVLSGEEGTILKSLSSPWVDGKKNHQIKFKLEIALDLKITGFLYGEEGTKNEAVYSRIVCESADGLLKTTAGGIKESVMKHLTENGDKLIGSVVTVECSGLSQNHAGEWSCLHPRYSILRDDKLTAQTLEECIDVENGALGK